MLDCIAGGFQRLSIVYSASRMGQVGATGFPWCSPVANVRRATALQHSSGKSTADRKYRLSGGIWLIYHCGEPCGFCWNNVARNWLSGDCPEAFLPKERGYGLDNELHICKHVECNYASMPYLNGDIATPLLKLEHEWIAFHINDHLITNPFPRVNLSLSVKKTTCVNNKAESCTVQKKTGPL